MMGRRILSGSYILTCFEGMEMEMRVCVWGIKFRDWVPRLSSEIKFRHLYMYVCVLSSDIYMMLQDTYLSFGRDVFLRTIGMSVIATLFFPKSIY